jgi:hypothetical protein
VLALGGVTMPNGLEMIVEALEFLHFQGTWQIHMWGRLSPQCHLHWLFRGAGTRACRLDNRVEALPSACHLPTFIFPSLDTLPKRAETILGAADTSVRATDSRHPGPGVIANVSDIGLSTCGRFAIGLALNHGKSSGVAESPAVTIGARN